MFKWLTCSLLLVSGGGLPAHQGVDLDRETGGYYSLLPWHRSGVAQELSSGSSFLFSPQVWGVVGEEAQIFFGEAEEEESGIVSSLDLEAVGIDLFSASLTFFYNYQGGYLSLEDWDVIDPLQLIAQFLDDPGDEIVHAAWYLEPTLNPIEKTVQCALQIEDDEGDHTILVVAIRAGKGGAEVLFCVCDFDEAEEALSTVNKMLQAHTFVSGATYDDFKEGDVVSSYGIGSFVRALLTADL